MRAKGAWIVGMVWPSAFCAGQYKRRCGRPIPPVSGLWAAAGQDGPRSSLFGTREKRRPPIFLRGPRNPLASEGGTRGENGRNYRFRAGRFPPPKGKTERLKRDAGACRHSCGRRGSTTPKLPSIPFFLGLSNALASVSPSPPHTTNLCRVGYSCLNT